MSMKNKKHKHNLPDSKSQAKIKLYQETLEKALKGKLNKEIQLADLKRKIELSKPILQKIQTKFKRRERIYINAIEHEMRNKKKAEEMSKQYMKLHELGIKIIQKNGLLNNYEGLDNYATRAPRINNHEDLTTLKKDLRQYVGLGDSHYISNRQNYKQNQPSKQLLSKTHKNETAYEILQKKLQIERYENPEMKQTLNFICDVFDKGINKIKNLKQKVNNFAGMNRTNHTISQTRIKIPNRIYPKQQKKENKKFIADEIKESSSEQSQEQLQILPKSKSLHKFIENKRKKLDSAREQGRSEQSIALINLQRAATKV